MIVLDIETSGLEPLRHSILSIGALDQLEPSNQFYGECCVWDGSDIQDEALAINGFTRDDCFDTARAYEAELITAFVAWATSRPQVRILAAQNPSFDLEFVQAVCARAGIACPFGKRTIDVHSLVWVHMQQRGSVAPLDTKLRSGINLDYALRYCGIPEEPKPHNALMGAKCHTEVISRIAYTKKALPEFTHFDIPWLTT